MKSFAFLPIVAALFLAAAPAMAGGLTFADPRCDPQSGSSGTVCIGHSNTSIIVTYEMILPRWLSFEDFVRLNARFLPLGVKPGDPMPANTMFLTAAQGGI